MNNDADAGLAFEPLVRPCTRAGADRTGHGCPYPQYEVSTPQLWDRSLGTMDRTGLCIECGAAIYRAQGRLYHAGADCFFLLPA